MQRTCPECGGELVDLDPTAEMDSGPKRYDCPACQLRFESDASGLLTMCLHEDAPVGLVREAR